GLLPILVLAPVRQGPAALGALHFTSIPSSALIFDFYISHGQTLLKSSNVSFTRVANGPGAVSGSGVRPMRKVANKTNSIGLTFIVWWRVKLRKTLAGCQCERQNRDPIAHNETVPALSIAAARASVLDRVGSLRTTPAAEQVELEMSLGRVLAEDIHADRDYPALSRSVRDGFAVRAIDLPGTLEVIGEVRAGKKFSGQVASK